MHYTAVPFLRFSVTVIEQHSATKAMRTITDVFACLRRKVHVCIERTCRQKKSGEESRSREMRCMNGLCNKTYAIHRRIRSLGSLEHNSNNNTFVTQCFLRKIDFSANTSNTKVEEVSRGVKCEPMNIAYSEFLKIAFFM